MDNIEKDVACFQSFSSSAAASSNTSRGGSQNTPVQHSQSDGFKAMKQHSQSDSTKAATQVNKKAEGMKQENSVAVEKTTSQVKKKKTRMKKKKKDENVVSKVSCDSESSAEDEEITKPDKLVSVIS